jgi:hypothetical protein
MNHLRSVYSILIAIVISSSLFGQHQITLDNNDIIEGRIVLNSPENLLLEENGQYAIVPRQRISKLYFKSGDEVTYNLVGLDLKMAQEPLPTGGALISKGAMLQKRAIILGIVGGVIASALAYNGSLTGAIAAGSVIGLVSFGVNWSGLSNIQKGGRLLDAIEY